MRFVRISALVMSGHVLANGGCHPKPTETTDAGPPDSGQKMAADDGGSDIWARGYPTSGTVTLQVTASPLPMEFLGRGSWAAFSPNGEHAIVGSPGRATFVPGDKVLPGSDPSNAGFAPDGKQFFVIHAGANALKNEVTIHATSDLHVVTKLVNALDPKWIDAATLAFDREGKVYELTGTTTKVLGPETPVITDRTVLSIIGGDAKSWLIVERTEGRPSFARRIDLTTGRSTALLSVATLTQFKGPEPLVVASPDLKRACAIGQMRAGVSIWCGTDDAPPEEATYLFNDKDRNYAATFISPSKLAFKTASPGTVGIIDLEAKTISNVMIPGATTGTSFTLLPGGKLEVARDFTRVGLVDLEARRYTAIGDEKSTAKYVAGFAPDDSAFAVFGSSLDKGLGIYRVKTR